MASPFAPPLPVSAPMNASSVPPPPSAPVVDFYGVNTLKVFQGTESRTTLILKNIPNKYTQSMLLNELDAVVKGEYDLFYLPVDFGTNCNMGYAFINMVNPLSVISVHEAFNGKKWSMFKSSKVCTVNYARIQGLEALTKKLTHSKAMTKVHFLYRHRYAYFPYQDATLRPLWFDGNGQISAPAF
jgi:hypothetical protein